MSHSSIDFTETALMHFAIIQGERTTAFRPSSRASMALAKGRTISHALQPRGAVPKRA